MADKRIYRRCGNCGAVLKPEDSFCPQCGIGTGQSYVAGNPSRGQTEQRYQTRRYRQESQGDRNRYQQGSQGDRDRYQQGSQGDRDRYQQGSQGDGNGYRQGNREDRNQYQKENKEDRSRFRQEKQAGRERYRQENLGGNWSEDWGRPVDENRVTAMQCVLIVLLVVLLVALLALGGFWMFGRSVNKTAGQRGDRQDAVVQTEQESVTGDIVTILDPGTAEDVTEGNQMDTAARSEETGESSGGVTQSEETGQGSGAGSGETGQDSGGVTQSEETGQDSVGATQSEETGQGSDTGTQSENTVQQSETAVSRPEISAEQSGQSSETAASWSQPESSTRLLTDSDLDGLDYDGLQMAINEIYARHGRIFKTPEIGSYFESQSWYEGTLDADHFDESVFSAIEAQNIQLMLEKMGDG